MCAVSLGRAGSLVSLLLAWGEGRAEPRAQQAGCFKWSAHPSGGVAALKLLLAVLFSSPSPVFVPRSSKVAAELF